MRRIQELMLSGVVLGLVSVLAYGSEKADFTGNWVLNSMKSKNMGFIAGLQATVKITQTDDGLSFDETSAFMGQERKRTVHYDFKSKPTQNEGSQGEKSETVSRWVDAKLVTTWTSEGANPGTTVVRTETRYLSADGSMMSVESARGSSPPVIMVFDKK